MAGKKKKKNESGKFKVWGFFEFSKLFEGFCVERYGEEEIGTDFGREDIKRPRSDFFNLKFEKKRFSVSLCVLSSETTFGREEKSETKVFW